MSAAKHTPGLLKLKDTIERVKNEARRKGWASETFLAPDGGAYVIAGRHSISAARRDHPVNLTLDGDRASVDTIIGVVVYGCDTLLYQGRISLREPTLRAAIAKATGGAA